MHPARTVRFPARHMVIDDVWLLSLRVSPDRLASTRAARPTPGNGAPFPVGAPLAC